MTQDRPDAPELLDAVAEFLFAELRGAVPAEERFRVLVAANVCAVVARELRAGEAPLREDLDLFSALLGRGPGRTPGPQLPGPEGSGPDLVAAVREAESALCAELRSGHLDDRLGEVAAALREHVRRKLEVARPGYAD
ncbi:MAG: DUF6285 domain-containing protein [Solirubrobacterales bacterium]